MYLRSVLATIALSALVHPFTSAASTLTIGASDQPNGYPFGSAGATNVSYQQVYSSTAFSGVEQIDAITFFPYSYAGPIGGTFTLSLSTTLVGVNQLSTDQPSNVGLDSAVFFTGTPSDGFTFSGTPYTYDPSMGNLLLTVTGQGTSPTAEVGGESPLTSRVYNVRYDTAVPYGTADAFGLETQFTTTDVSAVTPEPSSLALFGTGMLGVIGVMRKRFA